MKTDARLWKFWTWEIVLTTVLFALAAGGWVYSPVVKDLIQGREREIAAAAVVPVMVVTFIAYRLATGFARGFVKWIVRLMGSVVIVFSVMLLPALLLKDLLEPEYFRLTSPFVALFVLWCLYGLKFLIQWQTRLFYRLIDDER